MNMKFPNTFLISKKEIQNLLTWDDYFGAVEEAFKLHAEQKNSKTGLLHIHSSQGEFHVKAGRIDLREAYFGIKVNSGFFKREISSLPAIQGAILLFDGQTGSLLAIMDSVEITRKRTAATTAVACKYFAPFDKNIVTICGTGNQARQHLEALLCTQRVKEVCIYGKKFSEAQEISNFYQSHFKVNVTAVDQLEKAVRGSNIVITCTPSTQFFIQKEHIAPGTFIAAVGADSPGKQEIDPELLISSKVICDLMDQSIHVGEVQHAVKLGFKKEEIYAELGEIFSYQKKGRTSQNEVIIFDSTGTAIQDVAVAALVYKKVLLKGSFRNIQLAD